MIRWRPAPLILTPENKPSTSPGPVFGSAVGALGGVGVEVHWAEPAGYVWPEGDVQVGVATVILAWQFAAVTVCCVPLASVKVTETVAVYEPGA